MLRRLFFLFPDEPHAQRVVNELLNQDVPERRIHAIARNIKLNTLPQATKRQKEDAAFLVERFLWNTNLLVFAVTLGAFAYTLVAGSYSWSIISLVIMAATFIAAEQFVVHVPNVHLSEFDDALAHGEILLMIDVPSGRVAEIEDFIHHNHPEAAVGGVCWAVESFGL
jgi:hypothetical protein